MRSLLIALAILLASALPARAQFSIDFNAPGVSIGVNMPVYPQLVLVPGYPVYYDPAVNSNYFFYDGYYWVYWGDNWYASEWYNGPWQLVGPDYVPQYLLLVPVRYYRSPPSYFRSWGRDAPPHWGEHWGATWSQRRSGWDRWDRRSMPAAAPLPVYQRQYTGSRYPRAAEQQQVIRTQNYRYQPRDAQVTQHFQQRAGQGQPRGQQQVQQQGQQQLQQQGNPPRARAQTQQQVQQGAAPQVERQQMNRQRQQQVQQQQQKQQSTQAPTMGQGRPAPSGTQFQGRQNGPQERAARTNAGPPQGQGGEPKGAPRETRAAPQGPGPQGGGGGGQQARGGENRQGPQGQGGQQGKGEDKGARKGQGKQEENK